MGQKFWYSGIPIGRISTRCSWFKRAQNCCLCSRHFVFQPLGESLWSLVVPFGIFPWKKGSFSLQFRPFLRSFMSNWEKKRISSVGFPSRVWILFILLREDCWHFCFRYFLFCYRNIFMFNQRGYCSQEQKGLVPLISFQNLGQSVLSVCKVWSLQVRLFILSWTQELFNLFLQLVMLSGMCSGRHCTIRESLRFLQVVLLVDNSPEGLGGIPVLVGISSRKKQICHSSVSLVVQFHLSCQVGILFSPSQLWATSCPVAVLGFCSFLEVGSSFGERQRSTSFGGQSFTSFLSPSIQSKIQLYVFTEYTLCFSFFLQARFTQSIVVCCQISTPSGVFLGLGRNQGRDWVSRGPDGSLKTIDGQNYNPVQQVLVEFFNLLEGGGVPKAKVIESTVLPFQFSRLVKSRKTSGRLVSSIDVLRVLGAP